VEPAPVLRMPDSLRRSLFIFSTVGFGLAVSIVWLFYRPANDLYDVTQHPLARDFVNIWSAPQIISRYGTQMLFDFSHYYLAVGELFRSGVPDYSFIWSYPPTMLLFAEPFSLLPYQSAALVWTLSGFALYGAVVLARLPPSDRTIGLLALSVAPATIINTVVGQNGFFTAALVLSAVVCLDRRPWLAGALFGLLTVKPQLGLLVPVALLSIGAWRTMASAAITGTCLVAASVMFWGLEPWINWVTRTSPYVYDVVATFRALHGYMMPSVFASMRDLEFSPAIANVTQGLVTLLVIPAVFVGFRKSQDISLRALLLCCGSLLTTPYAFNYDMTAVTGAILWMLASGAPIKRWQIAVFGVVWVLPAAIYILNGLRLGAAAMLIGATLIVALMRIYEDAQRKTYGIPVGSVPTPRWV